MRGASFAPHEATRRLRADPSTLAGNSRYFTFSEGTLRTNLEVPVALRDDFLALVREIVEWRLAQYLERGQDG